MSPLAVCACLCRFLTGFCVCSLKDVVTEQRQLFLVFEWVDKDLKMYMKSLPKAQKMPMPLVKVRPTATTATPPATVYTRFHPHFSAFSYFFLCL